eukprot:1804271-Rhodomonas_salina.1
MGEHPAGGAMGRLDCALNELARATTSIEELRTHMARVVLIKQGYHMELVSLVRGRVEHARDAMRGSVLACGDSRYSIADAGDVGGGQPEEGRGCAEEGAGCAAEKRGGKGAVREPILQAVGCFRRQCDVVLAIIRCAEERRSPNAVEELVMSRPSFPALAARDLSDVATVALQTVKKRTGVLLGSRFLRYLVMSLYGTALFKAIEREERVKRDQEYAVVCEYLVANGVDVHAFDSALGFVDCLRRRIQREHDVLICRCIMWKVAASHCLSGVSLYWA